MGDGFAGERRRREGQRCGGRHVPYEEILELNGTWDSFEIVGSKIHRTRDQESLLVQNYRSATSHSCAWLNKKVTRLGVGKHPVSTEWGKCPWSDKHHEVPVK